MQTSVVGVDLVAEIVELGTRREVRGDGREHVAGVEGARDVLEVVARVRQVTRRLDLARAARRASAGRCRGRRRRGRRAPRSRPRAATPPTPGSIDREVDTCGQVRDRAREHERALGDRQRADPVRDVEHLHVGRDALDHAAADARRSRPGRRSR